ncbi:hypothetical protein [Kushneria phyllosphaerae]|uniref:Uncharacterized protein n=1 Tax=Kushneria phyllosphaerae TaxID=2100822 RepID=A0A2R8CGS4_9GAMM|nr:hypothetical protein [Kushneria phyllosphaerae]SPJ32070.1 hypothetical protein KSP9073_00070 [Kushneria phyllosphaerae]
MKASKTVMLGLSLVLVPVMALATSPPEDDSSATQPSNATSSSQNTGELSRQGGASGMEGQSGSMQRERQQEMEASHESSAPAIGTHGQRQQDGAGSMNEHNTTKTDQGTANIPDQRTQDDTAP